MDKRKATRRAISKCLAALCELDLMLLSDQMPTDDELINTLLEISAPAEGLARDLVEMKDPHASE